MKLNQYIDHTILKPAATAADVEAICREAVEYEFASVCVNTCHVRLVSRLLSGSPVKTCVVVGFPLGAMATEAKAFNLFSSGVPAWLLCFRQHGPAFQYAVIRTKFRGIYPSAACWYLRAYG